MSPRARTASEPRLRPLPPRKPLPLNTRPNPKTQNYETNRNHPPTRAEPRWSSPTDCGQAVVKPLQPTNTPAPRRRRGRFAAPPAPRFRAVLQAAFPRPCPPALPNGFRAIPEKGTETQLPFFPRVRLHALAAGGVIRSTYSAPGRALRLRIAVRASAARRGRVGRPPARVLPGRSSPVERQV